MSCQGPHQTLTAKTGTNHVAQVELPATRTACKVVDPWSRIQALRSRVGRCISTWLPANGSAAHSSGNQMLACRSFATTQRLQVRYAMQPDVTTATLGVQLLHSFLKLQGPALDSQHWGTALRALSLASELDVGAYLADLRYLGDTHARLQWPSCSGRGRCLRAYGKRTGAVWAAA